MSLSRPAVGGESCFAGFFLVRQNTIKNSAAGFSLSALESVRKENGPGSVAEPFFHPGDRLIQERGHQTEKENGEHYPIHFKELRQNGRENDKVGIAVNIIYILNGYLKKKLQ